MLGRPANSRSASAVSTSCRPMPVSWSSTCERRREQQRPMSLPLVSCLPRHQHPVIEIEQHRGVVVVAGFEREVGARTVLGGDGAQPQRTNIVPTRHVGLRQDFGPGKNGGAGKQRRYVPATVDGRNVKRSEERRVGKECKSRGWQCS